MSTPFFRSLASLWDGSNSRPHHARVLDEQFPLARLCHWKYAWLKQLEQRQFSLPERPRRPLDNAILAKIPSPRLVFVNGMFQAELSDTNTITTDITWHISQPAPDEIHSGPWHNGREDFTDVSAQFRRLNLILADTRVHIRVRSGANIIEPLHLVNISTPGALAFAWHQQHEIHLESRASLKCIEHYWDDGRADHYANTLSKIELGSGARFDHIRILANQDAMTSVFNSEAILSQDSHYYRTGLYLSTGHSLETMRTRLTGDRADLCNNGVMVGRQSGHQMIQLLVEHAARQTRCDLVWRGMAHQHSALGLDAQIHISAAGDQSQAQLSSKNLLLSPLARIHTQPNLVIDADNVRAQHGATVGQLDPSAIFYLRSRGIPNNQVVELLGAAFCQEPLVALPETSQRWVQRYLEQAIEKICDESTTPLT